MTFSPLSLAAGKAAVAHLTQKYGPVKVGKTSATGTTVHFGEFGMFIPGENPERTKRLIQQRTEELACAYIAWSHAEEHPEEREEMS